MTDTSERLAAGVIAIDTHYIRPLMDASHLIIDSGRAAFVDVGTYFSIPNLLAALAAQDLGVEAVDYVLLTHIHLDHAGGAGRLLAALPNARVLVHPRGAAHLIDPTLLIAATKAVYGDARFTAQYGDIAPIPAARLETVADGHRIQLGRRTLEFVHTPGHALHHVCIVVRDTAEVFTGDTFGVSYRELDTAAGEFILPTTSPTQFDPGQLHASIDRILDYRPACAYLTHYSVVRNVEKLAADLHAEIDVHVGLATSVAEAPDRVRCLEHLLFEHLWSRLQRHGFTGGLGAAHAVLDGDVSLNAAGLHAWLARRRA
jgi:glyoxylase-like metal-dependent hydrolase (beta-lactamase superfamily II)